MKSGLFVTSCGTDVGKTYVTALLCRQLRERGRAVEAFKPVVSGFDEADTAASDPVLLLEALGRDASLENIKAIAPWRYRPPLAPDMAATKEGRTLNFEDLVAFSVKSRDAGADVCLIEGVGGVMAPIAPGRLMIDWMQEAGLPVLLVVGSYLGAISHALTAVQVVLGAGLALKGVVISESSDSTVSLSDTQISLAAYLDDIPLITLSRMSNWRSQPDLASWSGL